MYNNNNFYFKKEIFKMKKILSVLLALMLVCAFAGRELTMRAYETAVKEKYRFFSFGDAMCIL